jgi:hypothetical protein
MGVYELSGAGSLKTPRTVYSSMNANNQYGAMVPIASAANGSANFNTIPQTFQDLYVVSQLRGVNANTIEFFFSTLSGSNAAIYSYTSLQGDGSSATSSRTNQGNTSFFIGVGPGANSTAGIFGSLEMWILNYTNTSTFKTVLYRFAADQNGSGETRLGVGLFASTTAITAVNVFGGNGTATGSTHTLYGIRAVSS